MVLAIAALLFQSVAGAQPAQVATSSTATPSTASHAVADETSSASLFPTSPDEKPVVIPKPTTENPLLGGTSADAARLNTTNTKANGTYSLNTVAMDSAQNSQSFSTIRIQDPKAPKQIGVVGVESYPSKRAWWTLAVAQHSAAFFDAYTTRRAVSMGAVEEDPMMRPFAHSPGIYAAIQAGPTVFDFLSRRMAHSESPILRRMWWLPQTGSTVTSLVSGVHNLGVARREK